MKNSQCILQTFNFYGLVAGWCSTVQPQTLNRDDLRLKLSQNTPEIEIFRGKHLYEHPQIKCAEYEKFRRSETDNGSLLGCLLEASSAHLQS